MKKWIKYSNFIIFTCLLLIVLGLQSHTHISTSLLSILPKGESKDIIQYFNNTKNAKILLLSVKGVDDGALAKLKTIEQKFANIPNISPKKRGENKALREHLNNYHLFRFELDEAKLKKLNVTDSLKVLYTDMISAFTPVSMNAKDPFMLVHGLPSQKIVLKNGHLLLGNYGYISYFSLDTNTLEEHQKLYEDIHKMIDKFEGVKAFSPIFYYVENAQAIRSDVNTILIIALLLLLLLYLVLLRDMKILIYTLVTLASSALFSTILLTVLYDEISIFVFVFGVSISSIAIDYMFHQYMHGYYVSKRGFNKEVFFGFLTTITSFFILSFTSFLLIKQITLFAIGSLFISYMHFAFLYPLIGFKSYRLQKYNVNVRHNFISIKVFFLFSLVALFLTFFWIKFDFNLRNLDYDNKSLKKIETFFDRQLSNGKYHPFMISGKSIDFLITNAQTLQENFSTVNLPISKLLSKKRFYHNKTILENMQIVRDKLKSEAQHLKFRKDYFIDAYTVQKMYIPYTIDIVKLYGLEIVKMGDRYISYGTVKEKDYSNILAYSYVKGLSLKEYFEEMMKSSMNELVYLGILTLIIIFGLLLIFTKRALLYALVFLLFPVAVVGILAYFIEINILHLFMLFIILAISIDYAIYLSSSQDISTKMAISYSLVSTFAGFGVLIFSHTDALFSLGIVASLGIVSIFILLLLMKGPHNEA